MNWRAYLLASGAGIVMAGVILAAWFWFQSPQASAGPEQAGLTDAPAARTVEVVRGELGHVREQLARRGLSDLHELMSAKDRAAIDRTAAIPLLRQQLTLAQEWEALQPHSGDAAYEAQLCLLVLEDPETTAQVKAEAVSDNARAPYARFLLAVADYLAHDADADGQIHAIDDYFAALKGAPDAVMQDGASGAAFFAKAPAASPAVHQHLLQRITDTIPGPQRAALLDRIDRAP